MTGIFDLGFRACWLAFVCSSGRRRAQSNLTQCEHRVRLYDGDLDNRGMQRVIVCYKMNTSDAKLVGHVMDSDVLGPNAGVYEGWLVATCDDRFICPIAEQCYADCLPNFCRWYAGERMRIRLLLPMDFLDQSRPV